MTSHCEDNLSSNSISFESKNEIEEELIDLDKVLPLKKDSNWLLESNNNSSDFRGSFNEQQFSNPLIKDVINNIYSNGKSKQILHHLMYWNDKMTISCDNYTYLCKNNNNNRVYKDYCKKRHSVALTSRDFVEENYNDSDSLTDSLDSLESITKVDIDNGNRHGHIKVICDRMTQSSISDYNRRSYVPQESDKLPVAKNVSTSQNILSRTYDKEDLEILKQTELSQSVFVPHISGSNIDHYSEIEFHQRSSLQNISNPVSSSKIEPNKHSSFKRLFPTANSDKTSNETIIKPRPNSLYQIDKLSKNTIDRCIKISQQKHLNLTPRSLLKTNENIFDTDVLTPINSLRTLKHYIPVKQSRIKSPMTKSFIR